MAELTIVEGIVVGGVGGAAAGLTVYLVQYLHKRVADACDSNKLYKWLVKNTKNEDGNRFASTRAIASWNNMTEDQVRYLCSAHPKIFLSTGEKEDRWSLYERQAQPRVRSL